MGECTVGEHGLVHPRADDVVGTLRAFTSRLKLYRLNRQAEFCCDDLEKLLHACDSLYRELEQAEATDE